MSEDIINELLRGEYKDPYSGNILTVPTRLVGIEDTLAGKTCDLVNQLGFEKKLAVVSDPDTYHVLGKRIEKELESSFTIIAIHLLGNPHADMDTVKTIRKQSVLADALIAVGSGTINDLCKYTASLDNKPYAVFGTAPSMNGYTSINASITENGMKKTLSAKGADGVFIDLEVLSGAPERMIRSGLGDSLSRPTAQADWLLSHLLLGTNYNQTPFDLLSGDEQALFDMSEELMNNDLTAMKHLARTLTISGFGMAICGGSYPASQGEHLISHYIEMMAIPNIPRSFHGEQIGVTTLSMAGLQEKILESNRPIIKPTTDRLEDLINHFGEELGTTCWKESTPKQIDASKADDLNHKLESSWSDIRERIEAVIRPSLYLESVLSKAGAPVSPESLGWNRKFYNNAVSYARLIRNRYTFLDFASGIHLPEFKNAS